MSTAAADGSIPGYSITTDLSRIDLGAVHRYLSERSYWAFGIPRALVERAARGSLCFGLCDERGGLAGFARVVTDRATFAYLCDVFVLPEHRGRGLSRRLMERVMAHPDLQGLRRFMLATRDAHGLYHRFGFEALDAPDRLMQIVLPNPYGGVAPGRS